MQQHTSNRGAAGLLLVTPGRDRSRMLLARRSSWVSFPLTWSVPGGKIRAEETPIDCALREAAEEIGRLPDRRVVSVVTDTQPNGWTFHTVIATTSHHGQVVADGIDAHEINSLRWVDAEQGRHLNLHPGLRRSWERLAARCDAVCRRQRMTAA